MFGKRVWVPLLLIAGVYVARTVPQWHVTDFGFYHDDSLYLTSGLALAEGQGYRFLSVPGGPPATKYPILYPWLLSLAWRVEPSFPEVTRFVFGAHLLLGAGLLAAWYFLFRQLGRGQTEALALTAVCSLHPMLVVLTTMAISDLMYSLLATAALVSAHCALAGPSGNSARGVTKWWIVAGILVSLAVMTRSVGVTVAGAIFLSSVLVKKARGPGLACAAACGAVFAGGMAWSWQAQAGAQASLPAGGPGYTQNLLFYTSYWGFWKLSVPDVATFWAQWIFNLTEVLKLPAMLCFQLPAHAFSSGVLQAVAIAVSALVVKGAYGARRISDWHPIHGALVLCLPLFLSWNFMLDRLFFLFLPLFVCGVWIEGRKIVISALETFRAPGKVSEKVAAALLCAGIASLAGFATCETLWRQPMSMSLKSAQRGRAGLETAGAYDWIRRNTRQTDRLIAYEDAVLYLRTGRQAMRALTVSSAAFYLKRVEILDRDILHLADTAKAVEAKYWLVTPSDFQLQAEDSYMSNAVGKLLADSPVVYASPEGAITIHDVSSLR